MIRVTSDSEPMCEQVFAPISAVDRLDESWQVARLASLSLRPGLGSGLGSGSGLGLGSGFG